MLVIATFTCGERCEAKMDTVVVSVTPSRLDEVVRKLSQHSCYYQCCPAGYMDLIVVEGELARCELMPESTGEELRVLRWDEFKALWQKRHGFHRDEETMLKKRRGIRRRRAVRKKG